MKKKYTVSDGKLVLTLQRADEGGYVVTGRLFTAQHGGPPALLGTVSEKWANRLTGLSILGHPVDTIISERHGPRQKEPYADQGRD